ncbi:MAG: glycosyltransferase family 4 protein [Planctomycetota bacterium]
MTGTTERSIVETTFKPVVNSAVSVAFVSTYVPRQCGIATFAEDLYGAVLGATGANGHAVIAINGPGAQRFEYPREVAFEIHRDRPDDYRRAADFLNFSDVDIVCVQHEFGIFGGDGGMHLMQLLRNLRKPSVVTLHTVLPEPEAHYRRGLMAVANWSNVLVTMTQHSRQLLIENYGIDPSRIEVIPHGAPPMPRAARGDLKKRFDLTDRHVILTFGLLGPGKGIETAIEAVAAAVRIQPNITYLIVGATHPEVKRRFGEDYRLKLQRMVSERGIRDNVAFYNQYVSKSELVEFLRLCDIYLVPYPNLSQSVSGTLSYALAQGCAVVSTPFLHAREVLDGGRGVLVEPNDPARMSEAIVEVARDPERIEQLRRRALQFGASTTWPEIGKRYAGLFDRIHKVFSETIRVEQAAKPIVTTETGVQPVFTHMRRLTDDTGILQHAIFRMPNRFHGYCVDDNARALQVALMNQDRLDDQAMGYLTSRYLSFLHYAQREDGWFHNFMSYRRQWLDDVGSADCQGRTVWALGSAVTTMHDPLDRLLAKQLFDRALPVLRRITSPRARAYSILGLASYLQTCPENAEVRRLLAEHAAALATLYARTHTDGWLWFEEVLTYANAKLPEALLVAGNLLENKEYRSIGESALLFVTDIVLEHDHFSLVGNQGWLTPGGTKAPFDQQPIDAAALISAYCTASLVLEDEQYIKLARKALDWFLGANDLRMRLYDFGHGGCADGLTAAGVSLNQGAESTLCCLRAISLMADPMNPQVM